MSLVNQVLKDLQHRRGEHPDTSGLLAADAVVAAQPRRRWLPLGIAAVAVGLVAFAAQQFLARDAVPPSQPTQVIAQPEPIAVDATPSPSDAESSTATETIAEPTMTVTEPAPEPEVVATAADSGPAISESAEATPVETAPARREPVLEPVVPSLTRTLVTTTPRQRADDAYNQGVRALSEGRRDAAESQFRTALGHDASHVDARLALANLLAGHGALRDAETQLQQGLRIAPNAAPLAERYARLLFERGDLAGAIGVLADAAPPIATSPDYHALLAALQQRAGNHAAAADIYAALVEVRPSEAMWWVGLGISLEAEQRPEAALHAYRQAARDSRVTTAVAEFIRERIAVLES